LSFLSANSICVGGSYVDDGSDRQLVPFNFQGATNTSDREEPDVIALAGFELDGNQGSEVADLLGAAAWTETSGIASRRRW